MLDVIVPQFKEWVQEHQIVQRSKELFYDSISQLNEEFHDQLLYNIQSDAHDPELLELDYTGVAFFISQRSDTRLYVSSNFTFHYNSKAVGTQIVLFNLDGEYMDDYWSSP